MPIINSRSQAKFDALIRTNKADSLMSFIMASKKVESEDDRKNEVANNLKIAYDFFKDGGAGTYGDGSRDIKDQFESHYTMGYEMGIWTDSNFHLNSLAQRVISYEITVSEYIGVVFLNLYTYYNKENVDTYHHFLYEVLQLMKERGKLTSTVHKQIISDTLPKTDKNNEQTNLLYNYLIATDFFVQVNKDDMKLSDKWINNANKLINLCNLEYKDTSFEDSKDIFKDKQFYANYVTKTGSLADTKSDESINDSVDNSKKLLMSGVNVLLYGVPGSGKSHKIAMEYCDDFKYMERVVFHPDYMNTDFVGQILPTVKGVGEDKEITYEFTPGPFTRILKKAIKDPQNQYYLVIEEVNRGNAPAIFGEIFQLLDREADGASSYKISNYNVANEIFEDQEEPIYIPSNLSILATMNTADQNVFTLDTAFQRRWDMKMIENDVTKVDHANNEILDTSVTWEKFNTVINNQIVNSGSVTMSSEDKRLGAYFVTDDVLKDYSTDENKTKLSEKFAINIDSQELNRKVKDLNSRFGDKVIKYLWDDVFKFTREDLFNKEYKSLDKVLNDFNNLDSDEKFYILKQDIREALKAKNTLEENTNE